MASISSSGRSGRATFRPTRGETSHRPREALGFRFYNLFEGLGRGFQDLSGFSGGREEYGIRI